MKKVFKTYSKKTIDKTRDEILKEMVKTRSKLLKPNIDGHSLYVGENENKEECVIYGFQLIELLNFGQKNGEKCKKLLEVFNMFKGV